MANRMITAQQALSSKRDFYSKKFQGNGYYPINKFVYHADKDCYEQLVKKNNGWYSWGIAYEKPFNYKCKGEEKTITNKSWWEYIFDHNSFILSFDEMTNNNVYDVE